MENDRRKLVELDKLKDEILALTSKYNDIAEEMDVETLKVVSGKFEILDEDEYWSASGESGWRSSMYCSW